MISWCVNLYFLFASRRHQNDHKRSKAIRNDHWFSFPYLAIVSTFGSH